jgi:hypothetical protein
MRSIYLVLAVFAALLTGCAKDLPEGKSDYVGLWKSNETSMLITASGRMEYVNSAGSAKTSISAPIQEISDKKIVVGVWFLSTTFKIDQPPARRDGVWSMTVDGKKLYRADETGRIPQAAAIPPLDKIRELVRADLILLSKGIAADDFSEYRSNASLVFQSQFSNERIRAQYKPLIEKKVELERQMVGDFVLTAEPSINPDGALVIRGRYPDSPAGLTFESLYVYAHPEWKLLGTEVVIALGK